VLGIDMPAGEIADGGEDAGQGNCVLWSGGSGLRSSSLKRVRPCPDEHLAGTGTQLITSSARQTSHH
jgi:hypothetical protein